VEGGLSIRELAALSQQAAGAVADAKNSQATDKLKEFSNAVAQGPLGSSPLSRRPSPAGTSPKRPTG